MSNFVPKSNAFSRKDSDFRFCCLLSVSLSVSVLLAERRPGWYPHWAEQSAQCEGESHIISSVSLFLTLAFQRWLHFVTLSIMQPFVFPKVVAKKRRDRGLPRAFEIFTDSKTYVLKAQDEKHAEEWLQCINVAVAQARERENQEATTYLWEPSRQQHMSCTPVYVYKKIHTGCQ